MVISVVCIAQEFIYVEKYIKWFSTSFFKSECIR